MPEKRCKAVSSDFGGEVAAENYTLGIRPSDWRKRMKCKYDAEKDAYLIDGEPCRRDEFGDPTYHCTARRTCSQHIAKSELTCPRCLSRTRQDIRQIATLSTLMLPAAIDEGVNSQAAALAGPAANPEQVKAVRFYVDGHATHLYREGKISGETLEKILNAMPDDDTWHPYSVTTRWQMMLSEDYGHPLPTRLSTTTACAYLERNLHRVSHDPEQDFPLLARELRQVRNRLESVLHNSTSPERGAFCPTCKKTGTLVRLTREYAHWCTDEDCENFHFTDESGDVWKCPRNAEHWWTQAGYVEELQPSKAG